MNPKTNNGQHPDANREMEGEGNKTADREYREGASKFAQSGKVDAGAKEAKRAVEEDDEELKRADDASRKPSAGDTKKDLQRASVASPRRDGH